MPRTNVVHQDGLGNIIHAADVNGPDQYLAWLSKGVYTAAEYGAKFDGATDDTAALNACFAAAPAGSVVLLPPGTALVGNLSSANNVLVMGAGRRKTTIQAKSGSTGSLLTFSNAWGQLRGLTLDCTNAPTMTALDCDNLNAAQIDDLQIQYGAIGINLHGAHGSCFFSRLYLKDQTTAAIQINEGGAEHSFRDVSILVDDAAVTMAAGFEWARTAVTDLGGLYLDNVRVTRSAGTITNGFYLHSTAVSGGLGSFMGVFGSRLVADSINGGNPYRFVNADNIRLSQPWATGTAGYGYLLDGSTNVLIDDWFASCAGFGAYSFAATSQTLDKIDIGRGRCTQGTVFSVPATGLFASGGLSRSDEINYDNSTYTNSGPNLAATAPNNSSYRHFRSPFTVLHPDGSNKEQSFGVQNALTNGKWSQRVDSGGNLQFIPDSYSITGALFDPNGGLRANGPLTIGSTASGQPQVFMGSGAPGLPNGATTVAAGSVYFRTDTPTTSGQRLYVCSAGGATPTWQGIL